MKIQKSKKQLLQEIKKLEVAFVDLHRVTDRYERELYDAKETIKNQGVSITFKEALKELDEEDKAKVINKIAKLYKKKLERGVKWVTDYQIVVLLRVIQSWK